MSERFAVVIPALNAEQTVGAVVRACRNELPDVVVVNDGSSDGTGFAAAAQGALVLQHPVRRGKGAAMKSGFCWALDHGFDGVIAVDADGQHRPSEITKLLQCRAETGAELILGGRSHLFAQMVLRRRIANVFSTWAIARLSRTGVTDSQCGFRLYSAYLLRSISLRTEGFEMDSEVIIRAGHAGLRVATVPIEMEFVDGVSTSYFRPVKDTLRIGCTVFRARFL